MLRVDQPIDAMNPETASLILVIVLPALIFGALCFWFGYQIGEGKSEFFPGGLLILITVASLFTCIIALITLVSTHLKP